MKEALLLLLVVVSCCSYPTYEEYLAIYPDKVAQYSQIQGETERRKARYDEVIDSFKQIAGYTPGVNKYTDWYPEEIQSNAIIYLGLSNLQTIPVTSRVNSEKPQKVSSRVGQPTSFDWRDNNVVTSIKDQGSCGSCWTFAAAAYAESKLIIAGEYDKNNIDLSEQYLLQCTQSSDCGGGYLEYAMISVQECPQEDKYPYRPFQSYSGICSSSGIRTGYDAKNFYNLNDEELISLLTDGPLAISISSQGWTSYSSGTFSCVSTAAVDHAVLLVGYTPSYWIIKNQWGSNWGMDGYIHIARGENDCLVGSSAHTLSQTAVLWSALLAILALTLTLL